MSISTREELLSSQVRRRIVDFVREQPGCLAAADLGNLLGLHVTTVRFHLDQLEQAGVLFSETQRRETVGRPRKVYTVAPESVPVNEAAYVVLADVLAGAIPGGGRDRAKASEKAGEEWARRHVSEFDVSGAEQPSPTASLQTWPPPPGATPDLTGAPAPRELPLREVVDVLARWGYRRETVTVEHPGPGCHRMTLQHCPMKEAATLHPEVVCAAHLGLVRGTLSRLGVADAEVTVIPLSAPDLCVVDLRVPAVPSDEAGSGVLDMSALARQFGWAGWDESPATGE
ncbi:hypothetical protein KEM60_03204 [Austwickia sp. TVS 96-490-7B]|uniref:helix-turn-helix transcriptional regulator n=1 Tax=Austwickia sp. TVS 96-490-7B TaxID=2830843 RepID=UPI001C59FB32|nr:helix-turn-helix domain-containing protein [Austwickia sp. TVS 96-490-7B]MBW3086974.1 hypothetical protein [Austwickia sp. TVS 96-490-7B]